MNAENVISNLTYCSYKFNRQASPEVAPERWATIFGNATEQMERRYQEETAKHRGKRQKYDTCLVCEVTLPMGEEFDEHCCCGRGKGTHPDCQRCNPDCDIFTGRRV